MEKAVEKIAGEMEKLMEEKREELKKAHPGFKVWVCTKCGKKWSIAFDVTAPRLTCDCGSTTFIVE